MSHYFIGATRFDDHDGMMQYFAGIMPLVVEHGGEFVVQGPCETMLEGDFPITSAAVVRFPDRQSVLRWYESEACQKLKALRTSIGASNAWLAAPFDAAAAQPEVQPGGENRYFLGVTKIHDTSRMQTYISRVKPMLRDFGGELVLEARCDGQPEGSVPADNVVVIRFDSADAANRWYTSPQYAALRASRTGFADSALWMIRRPEA